MSTLTSTSLSPPRRFALTLALALGLVVAMLGWRAWVQLDAIQGRADELATIQLLEAAAAHMSGDLEPLLSLDDPPFLEARLAALVEESDAVLAAKLHLDGARPMVAGELPEAPSPSVRVDLRRSDADPAAILLGRSRPQTRGEVVGYLQVVSDPAAALPSLLPPVTALARQEAPWLTLALVLVCAILVRTSGRLRRLGHSIASVTSGEFDEAVPVPGADEISWMSEQLVDLGTLLREQVERVHGTNENLRRHLQSKDAVLARQSTISSALVSPLETGRGLHDSATAIAEACEAELVLVYRRNRAGGWQCLAAFGTDDPAILIKLGAHDPSLDALARAPGVVSLPALAPSHRWMQALGRQLPLQSVVGAPLIYRERLQGAVVLAGRGSMSAETLEVVEAAARLLSIAVANITAFGEIQDLAEALTDKNALLVEQRDQLETANRLKSQFTATISHELRTPINAIVGYGELLEDDVYGPLSPEQRPAVSGILQAGGHLLSLVNQVLQLSCIEAGELTISPVETDLETILRDSLTVASPLCKDRPYHLRANLLQAPLYTDPERVHQILVNLLNNAIKFTTEGFVALDASMRGDDLVAISVRDSGPGIAPEHQAMIFEAFRQVEQDYNRAHDGVGLGLAISLRLARALGGRIELDSTPGVGSTFTLILPRRCPSSASAASNTRPDPSRMAS